MKVFAISDLHLSGLVNKPMTVFGPHWNGHVDKIRASWLEKVSAEDVVLIAGDISWGMRLDEGLYDVNSLADLPGEKVFIRGNHDYWWGGIGKIRSNLPDQTFHFLQNDSIRIGKYVICGSRGWTCPGSVDYTDQDEKLYKREAERFKLTLESAKKLQREGDVLIAMIHYPPFGVKRDDTIFTRLFEEYKVDTVVYGHLHGYNYYRLKIERNGINYCLTASDQLSFRLTLIDDSEREKAEVNCTNE